MGREYFTYLQQHGGHDRLLRQEQVLGRTTDVYETWPLYQGNSSGYGRALIWIDQQYPLVLRLEMKELGQYKDQPHHWVYRVVSLTFGHGPSADALAYRPPVKPRQPPSGSSGTASGSAGPNASWQVPKGFIPAGTPRGYILSGATEDQDPMWSGPSAIEAFFRAGAGFVDIKEQVRVGGLPAALKTGRPHRAGRCEVWTGRYAGTGLRRLALHRGKVSLLVVPSSMLESQLVRYAATKICA
jgi:hypothetical protein